ncbi:MAG: 6-phosphogluconolactonase [Planctomycetes bacterium]|nr:6-phosphogluconolactonase [Planctomycetota bacterium]
MDTSQGGLRVFDTTDELFRAAADAFTAIAREAIARREVFAVALAGGSTPRRLYQLLADLPYRDQIDWPRLEVFWGDERAVPADDPDSNYKLAWDCLLSHVPIDPARVHRMQGESEDPQQAAADYQKQIAETFGVPAEGPPPRFDLILLGIGEDGHTASLFPYTSALDVTARWTAANDVANRKTHRLTMTLPIINRARHVIFLVAGEGKASIASEILEGPRDPQRLPSQAVRPDEGQLCWFLDRQAAGRLRGQA